MYFEIPGTSVRVLGSLHGFPAGSTGMPAWVGEAYDWCELLVHEHAPDALSPFVGSETRLQDVLRPATWSALAAALPSDPLRARFNELQPWAAMVGLGSVFQFIESGVEPQLLPRAAVDGKPTSQLETGEEFCRGFLAVPLSVVEDAIDRAVQGREQFQLRLQAMHRAWLARDRDALLAAVEATGMFQEPALREAGLGSRNRAWAPKVRQLMELPGRTLVVVGALHLCGPGNLEECLGVTFRPV